MSDPAAPRAHGAPSIPYQPGLDGLRGVAVLAVLLYHGAVTWMRGGFLGVDVFFVLSGFLITTLLLTEWGRAGRIDLVAFWVRRARRLLPALALVLVGIVAYAAFVTDPTQAERIRDDGLSAIFYGANWRFVFAGESYFEQFATPSPLRHMWSLAIEEQFYLMWPFVVLLLVRARPRLRLLSRVFAGSALASALLMAVLFTPGEDPSRVYYGTDTRAQALLVGAALAAFFLARRKRTGDRAAPSAPTVRAGLVGAIALVVMLVVVRDTSEWMYRGGYLLVAVATAAVIAAAVQPRRNLVRAALGALPLRWVGRVSYGLYLWHWPVYLTLTEERVDLDGTPLLLARLALTTAFAVASYVLVEMPIRRGEWPRHPRRALIAVPAVVGVLVLAFVAVPAVRDDGGELAVASTPSTTAPPGAGPPPRRVLVVGDSVAKTLGDGFDRESHDAGVELFNRGDLACGLAQRATIEHGGRSAPTEPSCDDWPAKWAQYAQELTPDVSVVIFDVFVVQDLEVDGRELAFATLASDEYLLAQLDKGVQPLRAGGKPVVLLTAPYNRRPTTPGQDTRWDEDDPKRIDHWNGLLRRYARRHADEGVSVLDLNAFLAPDGTYTNARRGVELRYDGVHFNPEAGQLVFRWLLPRLPADGGRATAGV